MTPTPRSRGAGPSRRRLLAAAAAGTLAPAAASLAFAQGAADPQAPRLVLAILRGGMDGLGAVPAVGDPAFAGARGPLAAFGAPPLPLDGPFALHPALAQVHAMHAAGELAVVHAVGLAYRDRSHFDAQQVLESGGTRPFELATGWLGRALAAGRGAPVGLALDTAVPLVLRGHAAVDTWAPSVLPEPTPDLVARLERLYADDAVLRAALGRARALRGEAAMAAMGGASGTGGTGAPAPREGVFAVLARRAAEFLGDPRGPQAAVLQLGGWDSHAGQANPNGGFASALRQLDAGLAALRAGLVANGAWSRTVVVVASEFGREVQANGTLGTDHGTGGAAFVLGGPVAGGRVVADWPGLARADRFEGRDLRTTTDLRAVLAGVLGEHLRVPRRVLLGNVFPGSDGVRPLALLRG
jgi:uncharacterized protein (DUF1501 family)